jgi:hypothetical protein
MIEKMRLRNIKDNAIAVYLKFTSSSNDFFVLFLTISMNKAG